MTDDFLKRAKMALHDMNGRVEAGKLAMFERTIDLAEAQSAHIRADAEVVKAAEELGDAADGVRAFIGYSAYAPDVEDRLDKALAAFRLAQARAEKGDE